MGGGTPIHYEAARSGTAAIADDHQRTLDDVPLDRYTALLQFLYVWSVQLNVTAT